MQVIRRVHTYCLSCGFHHLPRLFTRIPIVNFFQRFAFQKYEFVPRKKPHLDLWLGLIHMARRGSRQQKRDLIREREREAEITKMNPATQSPPTGPRPRWTDEEIEFYTHANFLRAFGEYHEQNSHPFDEEDPALANRAEDEVNIRNQLLPQGYLNGVAYLCDVKKGGNTVSANGIDQNIKLYIAVNANLPWSVREFIIKVVMKTDFLNHPMDVVVREILEKAVEKARHRIDFYVEQFRRSFVNCRASLETHFRGESRSQEIEVDY